MKPPRPRVPLLKSRPSRKRPIAEMRYVAAIIGRRPTVSKRRPRRSAPRKLAMPKGMR
jgi:hypothetical protein